MKLSWTYGLFAAAMLTVPASSQVSIYVGVAPPVMRYEAPPPPPAPEFIWIEGYWIPQGHHYRWLAGHYERPPFQGAYWAHPHYDHYSQGWQYHEGYWSHEDHDHDHGHGHAYGHYKDKGDDDDHDHGRGHGHD